MKIQRYDIYGEYEGLRTGKMTMAITSNTQTLNALSQNVNHCRKTQKDTGGCGITL